MRNLTDEEKKNFMEWSEGNKYLYELLCACWKNEIPTHASCGGHEEGEGKPYLSIIINENSFPFFERILEQIQDMQNIVVTASVRNSGNGQLYDDNNLRCITFYAQKHNCYEMFYKMKKGIESKGKREKLNSKAKEFLSRVKILKETSREELQEDINNNIVVSSTFSTKTQEFIEYENSKKLTKNSKFIRFFRKLLPFSKTNLRRYDELQQKYGFLQREYIEYDIEKSTGLEQYRVENLDNRENIQHVITRKEKKSLENNER